MSYWLGYNQWRIKSLIFFFVVGHGWKNYKKYKNWLQNWLNTVKNIGQLWWLGGNASFAPLLDPPLDIIIRKGVILIIFFKRRTPSPRVSPLNSRTRQKFFVLKFGTNLFGSLLCTNSDMNQRNTIYHSSIAINYKLIHYYLFFVFCNLLNWVQPQ